MKRKIGCILTLMLLGCASGEPSVSSLTPESSSTESVSSAPEIEDVKVIVLAGQSNAVGYTQINQMGNHFDDQEIATYKNGFDAVKIRFNCEEGVNTSWRKFVPTKLGQGKDNLCFGPEVGIGEYLSKNASEDIYIIKYAVGGTTLVSDWRSPSSGTTGRCYAPFIEFVHESIGYLEAEYKRPKIEALCWMQGESDADEFKSKYYYDYLSDFVGDVREEFKTYASTDGIGFVDAGISDWSWWTHYQVVNAAKKKFASESEQNIYFDTIELGLSYEKEPVGSPDGCHYDSDAMILLGQTFAEMLKEYFL